MTVTGIITMVEWSVLKDVRKLAWTETDVPDSLTETPSAAEFLDVTHPIWPWEPQSVLEKMTVLLLVVMVAIGLSRPHPPQRRPLQRSVKIRYWPHPP